MTQNELIWIKTGYEVFATSGSGNLRIESLAQKVGISKSSFYHYFADIEVFTQLLMNYHLEQSKIVAEKERNAQNISPELIDVLIEHKIDLLFNRQLRFFQEKKLYKETLIKSNQIVGKEFITVWVKDLKLTLNRAQIESLFELALENFFLQINIENLNSQWLTAYFEHLKIIAKKFE